MIARGHGIAGWVVCGLLGAAILGACGEPRAVPQPSSGPAPTATLEVRTATCLWVKDGDTIAVKVGASEDSVRLLGIDADEKNAPDDASRARAALAAERLRGLVDGKTVSLHVDPNKERGDRDRLLAYVHRGTTDVGALLLREGWVQLLDKYAHPRAVAYNRIAREARRDRRGQWGDARRNATEPPPSGLVKPGDAPYIASWRSEVFHKPSCSALKKAAKHNLVGYVSRDAAIEAGRRPCKLCHP